MGCNCGQGGAAASSYVYTDPNGTSKTYKNEIEAKAAMIRNGGGTYVTVSK